ncbi:short-subunit dehydrogenase [Prauserella shujinwangii]|uniref:Short-subunit dehydrogenase n=1 Tax=Prauserella shujinwangii TaxID=1453103 RepID=A0A2T0LLF5_9PSEU|nr:SDR family NAD(P)-dependent oxidoreductase [Prauserella shujinwangii]PRX43875.1 short-subunit dehydrogenase [Prauserella shujinwangii]
MTESTTRPLAVVTGASSGIGLELAKQFAEHGFDLVVSAEDAELEDARRELESYGVTTEAVRTDLATYDGVEELVRRVSEVNRPVNALVLNAGVGANGAFVETELEDHLRVLDLNVRSALHLARRILPGMVRQHAGRVLFTSSVAGLMPGPYQSVYAATKAFLTSFSEALRDELRGTGVTVTALLPGPTDTEFFERAGMQDTKIGAGEKDPASLVARQGYEATIEGREQVVAGARRNRVQAAVARVAPDSIMAAVHRRMSRPGSARR